MLHSQTPFFAIRTTYVNSCHVSVFITFYPNKTERIDNLCLCPHQAKNMHDENPLQPCNEIISQVKMNCRYQQQMQHIMSVTCITDDMGIEGCIGPNGKCVQRQQAFCRAAYMILHKACSIQPPQTETDKRKEGNVHTSPTLVPPAGCAKF